MTEICGGIRVANIWHTVLWSRSSVKDMPKKNLGRNRRVKKYVEANALRKFAVCPFSVKVTRCRA
jgi:hypothetical protein